MTIDYINEHGLALENSILTVGEVSALLGIHPDTVRRWSDLGLFPTSRFSQYGECIYRYEEISTFLDVAARRF